MRLKELRLKGFKSFANSTRIGFDQQVVGVVGPNGAGKSNIVDSIRWVLGEQKGKDLRTDNKIDVIFNGTKSKKKSSVAEVYLVFDNTKNIIPTEYKQVEIGRVLYRSGDSEYQLNGTKCRRKDILNLFMDTGIGSNSYAIIQLGMVDDILFDKENARHKMFEQAAGISKFKVRKRETLLKLKSTQIDLERVKDILHELESNMKSLEKQAKRAKKFYELKEQYKELSISLSGSNYKIKSAAFDKLKAEITTEEDLYREVKNKLLEFESTLEKVRTENLTKEQSLSENQKEFNTLNDQLRSKENEKQINLQEKQFNQNALEKLIKSIESNKADKLKITEELVPINEQRSSKDLEHAEENKTFQEVEKKYLEVKTLLQSLQGDSDSQISILQNYENKVFELEKKLVVTENNIERTQNLVSNLTLQISDAEKEEILLKSSLGEVVEKEKVLVSELTELENQRAKRIEKLQETDQALTLKSDQLNIINRKIDSKQNEHDLIKDMIDNLEGFPASTKFLVEKWKKTPILSNVIDASAEYKTGLEIFLQPYLNYFVVDRYSEAIEAVNLLSAAQKGKAQFFILNEVNSIDGNRNCTIPGTVPAISVLDIDDKYRNLLNVLLHNVFFIEEWNDSYYDQLQDGITVIDKGGKYSINKKQLTGGSVGLFEGKKLGREKTLKKLFKEIEKLSSERELLSVTIEELKEEKISLAASTTEKSNEPLKAELESVKSQRIQLETQLGGKSDINTNLLNQIKLNGESILEFQQLLSGISGDRDQSKAELQKFKDEREKATGEIDKIIEQSQHLTEEYNTAKISLIKSQNHLESLDQDINFKTERLNKIIEELANAENESTQLKESIHTSVLKSETLEEDLKALYKTKAEMVEVLNQSEQNYFSERSSINELETETQKTRSKLNEKQIHVNELKSKLQNIQFEISAIRERLSIEFQMEKEAIEELLKTAEETEVTEEMEYKVQRLRTRLENYGEINPMAVQAYDEVKERYELIEGQRNDILEAEASLLETINEIQNTASEKFLTAFNKVNSYFGDVFRSLFTEDDQAEIILTDPENPLESNIEIIARPKGKRPSTLKQLSGGERTLTATALLFSLYLLKPAPFCIFDEVDAPLDDSNIQKFVNLIKEFSKESQFVIITHNKATMAAVDTLYGVFMQEKGVSGVAEVDFRDYDHEEIFQSANVN